LARGAFDRADIAADTYVHLMDCARRDSLLAGWQHLQDE
tara:strand:- start:4353 stop:4469 length:117 start_codon:yes stop_codon:yes gene_type:complete